jgi:hypothetical protein
MPRSRVLNRRSEDQEFVVLGKKILPVSWSPVETYVPYSSDLP